MATVVLTEKQRDAKEEAKNRFFAGTASGGAAHSFSFDNNVVGVGIGPKFVSGSIVGEQEAVRIYVRVKIPRNEVDANMLVPPEFGGLATDVIEVGDITASAATMKTFERFLTRRPASCGVSAGHPKVSVGTLGCLVEKAGDHFILSNNHVLANANDLAPADPMSFMSNVGDAVIQRATFDGGASPADDIATLSDWETLKFGGAKNIIDAAIARVGDNTQTTVEPDIIDIGQPRRTTKAAAIHQSVRKHGRTTGHTVGVIIDLGADIWVDYGVLKAWFEDQIAIIGVGCAAFSQKGDSGSLVVDAVDLSPVGLLFADGNGLSIANKIDDVLNHFSVSVVGM